MKEKSLLLVLIFLFSQSILTDAQTNMRAWHGAGQTWLVWEDTVPYPETYRIYRAAEQISDISSARQIGRIFKKDWIAFKLKILWDTTLTWTIPDGSGGVYTLQENEALFVYTPHEAKTEHFAVVRDGNSVIGAQNSVGPITQTVEKVQCHLQLTDTLDGAAFRVFAHWIDGRENWDQGRIDYPVMANEHFNGTGQMFRIWEYPEGERPELVPLVVALHGGGGWFGMFKPMYDGVYKSSLTSAMFFCPDDGLDIKRSNGVKLQKSYWLGFWEDYNRFLLPEEQSIPDTGLVINYTMRRIIWELDWLIENEGIDPNRISLMGGSMGGRGANYLARAYPEHFASWLSLSPGIQPGYAEPFTGTAEQNLTTNLPGNPGVMQVMDLHSVLSSSKQDIPFGKLVGGRNDQSLAAMTPDVIQAYQDLDDAGFGCHIYWDDRGHVYTEGSYWSGSFRQTSQALTLHRSNRSFPAFFHVDQDLELSGRQPDIGNGDPDSGTPWGTWGGYCSWDAESIVDSAHTWQATIYLTSSGDYPVDISVSDSSSTNISIRRPQQFTPLAEGIVSWELMRLSDSRIMQSGWVNVGKDGVVTLPEVTIYKEKCQLKVLVEPTSAFAHLDGDGAPNGSGNLHISPNPFYGTIRINFNVTNPGNVVLRIHDLSGKDICTLIDNNLDIGRHNAEWDGHDNHGLNVAPGIYIIDCINVDRRSFKKIVKLK